MSRTIEFSVNAVPVAQPRQRHAISKGGRVINYTPANSPVNQFKASVAYAAKMAYAGPVLTCPVKMKIIAVFPRPWYITRKKSENCRVVKSTKPDWDNLGKSVSDALNGVLYHDDALIYSATVEKFIGDLLELPSVRVTIEYE